MNRKLIPTILAITLLFQSSTGRCDFWGGDLPLLAQIIVNTAQQLIKLKEIIANGKDNLELMRNINQGINDSLSLIRTAFPNINPGLYGKWDQVTDAIREVERIYGSIVPSPEAPIQRDADQSVAEAVSLNNTIYKYTKDIDEIGEAIKQYSHSVSPGGAQKLTAQSMGIVLNVLNQSLRTQATGLKLQAQALAIQNHHEKETTRKTLETSEQLQLSMKAQETTFRLPRVE